MQLLLEIWREASRFVELQGAVGRMATLLSRRLPARTVLVRRFDPVEGVLETVGSWRAPGHPSLRRPRTSLTPLEMERLRRWLDEPSVVRTGDGGDGTLLRVVTPDDMTGPLLAGPLLTESGEAGVLLVAVEPGRAIAAGDSAVVETVLDPFAVALANGIRFELLERSREAVEAENRALLSRLHRQDIVEAIVGADGTLRAVMDQVEQVAGTDVPVLILGETGTGKEVIARAIHARSGRRDGPIVRVNCGAIPSELIDSDLFGHEKGSFTGAIATRKGWFERAHGGTLFLDEVAELSLAAQVRLLRVLQDGSFERVGGQEPLTADVRIVAATHRDMDRLVADARFREDLWYRISVFPIYLPPLRARRDDIPVLAEHFARNAGLRFGGEPLAPSEADLELLLAYPWPGNVREMAAVMERAAILGGGHRLDLAGAMGTKLYAVRERTAAVPLPAVAAGEPVKLDDAIRRHIERALAHTAGRIEGPAGAAAILGVNPSTLRGRMRKLGIGVRPVGRDLARET